MQFRQYFQSLAERRMSIHGCAGQAEYCRISGTQPSNLLLAKPAGILMRWPGKGCAPLATAITMAATQHEPQHLHGLKVVILSGIQMVDVTVQKLLEPAALKEMMMVIFRDVETAAAAQGRSKGNSATETTHAVELQQYRNEIQALREETRASREELKVANEELQTIKNELQTKLDDLALAQSDLQNTLNSIEIAILFLDQNLNVRRYTDRTAQIINLR